MALGHATEMASVVNTRECFKARCKRLHAPYKSCCCKLLLSWSCFIQRTAMPLFFFAIAWSVAPVYESCGYGACQWRRVLRVRMMLELPHIPSCLSSQQRALAHAPVARRRYPSACRFVVLLPPLVGGGRAVLSLPLLPPQRLAPRLPR